ncbi:UNVERIFIED_CONTAM: hypothetical protein RMT77_000402 [Armadillidium vulgare]
MKGLFFVIFALIGISYFVEEASALFFRRNLFRPRAHLASAQILEFQIQRLQLQIKEVESQIDELTERIENLENGSQSGCPSSAPSNSVTFDGFCYYFESDAKSFVIAQMDCSNMGGKLAEPSLSDDDFYQQIRSSFSAARTASQIYLGIVGETSPSRYKYASPGGAVIPTTDPRWNPTPPAPSDNLAGVLVPDGTEWNLSTETKTAQHPYICQFPTV